MHTKSGFTLIEMLITMSVIAILAAIATPSMMDIIRKQQLVSETRAVVDEIKIIRSTAILNKKAQFFEIVDTQQALSHSPNKVYLGKYAKWQNKPEAPFSFNMFGFLNQNNQCFIIEHIADESLTAVVLLSDSGNINYNKALTSCPTNP